MSSEVAACTKEDFLALKAKSYRNIPRILLKNILKELPDYAVVVYLALYDLAELNARHPGTVFISHADLAEQVGKSESSVKRAVKFLSKIGYLNIVQYIKCSSRSVPNIFHIVCPQSLLDKAKEEPNRKNVIEGNFLKPKNPNLNGGGVKNEPHKNINSRVLEPLLLTIGEEQPSNPNSTVVSERHFENKNNQLSYFLNYEERLTIIKKLKWMYKNRKIHDIVAKKYRHIDDLIAEVMFHCAHRDLILTKSFMHALRGAAKLIRDGKWNTPKRLLQSQMEAREQEALRLKKEEIDSVSRSGGLVAINDLFGKLIINR